MGQINMITASSFTGLQGSTLGYDILRNPEVDESNPLFSVKQWDGSELPIYDSKPLQNALVEYFGTEQERRHPLTQEQCQFVLIKVLWHQDQKKIEN